ncbi:MAG: PrsW family glutamic-type intramembrane protease [Kiritimatiellia bacterium]
MDIKCPRCGTEYEIDKSEYGRFVKCEVCGKGFVAGTSAVENALSEEGVKKSAEAVGKKFREFTGTEKLEGFSVGALFADVFKKHTVDEIESYFTVGTPNTVPDLKDVDVSWPRPWMFLRALIGSGVVYFLFACASEQFKNVYLIPGQIMTGAMAIPLATLLFFFEMNARRNVSLYRVIRLVFLGGILSLIFSLVLFELPSEIKLGWMGASIAGLIEEPGKLIALLVVARSAKYKYKLNGLLFGACVGTGFATFESMGYAFTILLREGIKAMNSNIMLRGLLSPFGHIAWTAICGAAIWRVKGSAPFTLSMVKDGRFWRLAIVPVVLHIIWNADFELPFYGKQLLLGFVAWTVILALIQEGLKEIRVEKELSENPGVKVATIRDALAAAPQNVG